MFSRPHCCRSLKIYFSIAVTLLITLFAIIYGIITSEKSIRIGGVGTDRYCSRVFIGISKTTLRYPLLGSISGWSRGIPEIIGLEAEVYLFQPHTGNLRKISSIRAPKMWKTTSHFGIIPRTLPDGSLLFKLTGCSRFGGNCVDSDTEEKYYRIDENGQPHEIINWPNVTREESRNYSECTAYINSPSLTSAQIISIRQRGRDWTPILELSDNKLKVIKVQIK